MNCVNLIGNIGSDIELKQTANGKNVCNINLAVTEYGKTNWIAIVAWDKLAETIYHHCVKGSKIGITGRISVREYLDKYENKRRAVEIIADQITFVGKKDQKTSETPSVSIEPTEDQDFEGFREIEDDGTLPF